MTTFLLKMVDLSEYSHMSESGMNYIQTNPELLVGLKIGNADFQSIIFLYLCDQNTKKSIGQTNSSLFIQLIIFYLCPQIGLVLFFVEEEVFFGGVVGPDVFNAFVCFALVFHFLEVFNHFEGCS